MIKKTKASIETTRLSKNDAARIEYQNKLMHVMQRMNTEIYMAVYKSYQQNESEIAMDASPATEINKIIDKIIKKYAKIFDTNALAWATKFVTDIDKFSKRDIQRKLAEKAITIQMDTRTRELLNKQRAAVLENVQLITNITQQQQTQIQGDVMRAMERGRDLKYLEEQLKKRGIQGEKRIKFIALDQLDKVTSTLNTQRSIDAGFDEGIWLHSHAGKQPRPDHVAANGKRYKLAEGCLISGEYIYPGELPNCRCSFKLVVNV